MIIIRSFNDVVVLVVSVCWVLLSLKVNRNQKLLDIGGK